MRSETSLKIWFVQQFVLSIKQDSSTPPTYGHDESLLVKVFCWKGHEILIATFLAQFCFRNTANRSLPTNIIGLSNSYDKFVEAEMAPGLVLCYQYNQPKSTTNFSRSGGRRGLYINPSEIVVHI